MSGSTIIAIFFYVFNTFDRIWELSFFSCYLNSLIISLFMSYKTYNFGQITKIILLFEKMFCKNKCAWIISFNKNYYVLFETNMYVYICLMQNNRFK